MKNHVCFDSETIVLARKGRFTRSVSGPWLGPQLSQECSLVRGPRALTVGLTGI